MASGDRAACSSTSSMDDGVPRIGRRRIVPIHGESAAAPRRPGAGDRRATVRGSATAPSSSVWKCPISRTIVSRSKRSVLYSNAPTSPSRVSSIVNVRSKRAAGLGGSSSATSRSPSRSGVAMGLQQRKADLDERVVAGHALGLDRLDDAIEGDVLMLEGHDGPSRGRAARCGRRTDYPTSPAGSPACW